MKKVLCIIIPIVVVVLCVGIYFGVSIINSPKYALGKIAADVKQSGIDGLNPYLTKEARHTVSALTFISENEIINLLLSRMDKNDYLEDLKENLKDVEWELSEVKDYGTKSDVVLRFNYKGKLEGTIAIKMTKENGDWLICGVGMPKLTDIGLIHLD